MTHDEVTAAMKAEGVDAAHVRAKGERVPTTDEIRNWATYVPDTSVGMRVSERDAAAFDRWLSQHDREIQAQALRDAATAEFQPTFGVSYSGLDAQERLLRRADRLTAKTEEATT